MSRKLTRLRNKEIAGKRALRQHQAHLKDVRFARHVAVLRARASGVSKSKLNTLQQVKSHVADSAAMKTLRSKEAKGKEQLKDHELMLRRIRMATKRAMKHARQHGTSKVKINKLRTKEKLNKLSNSHISNEVEKDTIALQHAKEMHADSKSTKQQKLDAMKGEVRGLLFLKALKAKAKRAQAIQRKENSAKPWAHALKKEKAMLKANHIDVSNAITRHKHSEESAIEMIDESSTASRLLPWGEIEGVAELNAQRMHAQARLWDAEGVSVKESRVKQAKRKSPCACNGVQNKNGHGATCRDWEKDGTAPWCYASFGCSRGTTSRNMQGVKWVSCEPKAKKALKNMAMTSTQKRYKAKLQRLKAQAKATVEKLEAKVNSLNGIKIDPACSCTGTMNSKGHGAKCGHWGSYSQSWCYTSIACKTGYTSSEVAGAKWVIKCSRKARREEAHDALTKAKKRLSKYDELHMQLGDSLEAHGQGVTRPGWSWGVLLPSNSQYPACVQQCRSNDACVGVSYATAEVPSNDPAASSVSANTCHQFQGITQNNDSRLSQTWLKPS
jgi:hypothetical protein